MRPTARPAPSRSERAWLGVKLRASEQGAPGVVVDGVIPNSPAARAGLIAGDLLMSLDGVPVSRPDAVTRTVATHTLEERLAVTYERAGEKRIAAVELETFPGSEEIVRRTHIGQAAPGFEDLKAVQGSVPGGLAELRGKVVVLEFWASWCVACQFMTPVVNGWHARYGAQGVVVLGLTMDSVEVASRAARYLGMSYPVAADESGRTTQAYDALALPTLFVIDQKGVVRDVVIGYSSARLREVEGLVERLLADGTPA